MEQPKIVFTGEDCIKAIKKAEKNTRIIYDESPHNLFVGKSRFMLEMEEEIKKLLGSKWGKENVV